MTIMFEKNPNLELWVPFLPFKQKISKGLQLNFPQKYLEGVGMMMYECSRVAINRVGVLHNDIQKVAENRPDNLRIWISGENKPKVVVEDTSGKRWDWEVETIKSEKSAFLAKFWVHSMLK